MKKTIAVFILLFIVSGSVYSQLIRIKLGPVIGLTSPTSDFSGEVSDYYAGTKYGMKSAVNFGAMGKINIGPIGGRLSINYSSMSNSGVPDPSKPNSSVEVKNSILLFTVGAELGITIPFTSIRPYGGIDLLISSIGGSHNFQSTPEVSANEIEMSSASRTGLGLAIGTEIGFGKTLIMDFSLRYNLHNLFSKSYEGVTTSNDRNYAYSFLNDDADPNYSASDSKHPIGSSRNISTIQIQLGILFGL